MGAGCRRPEEKLVPFGQQPEGYVYGEPKYYATAMPTRTGAIPLVAKSYEGRPIKLEGNAKFPGSNGGTDRYAQASILDLYDPDRAKRFTKAGNAVSRNEALGFLDELSKKFAANQGEGLAFLAKAARRRHARGCKKIIADKFPKSQWFTYDAIDSGSISVRRRRRSASRCVRFSILTRRRSSCRSTAISSVAKTMRITISPASSKVVRLKTAT